MTILNPAPIPNDEDRRQEAFRRRQQAAGLAITRPQPGIDREGAPTINNGEEGFCYSYAMSFTKGLPRNEYGLVVPQAYEAFVAAINGPMAEAAGGVDIFDATVPLGPYAEPGANAPYGEMGDHPKFYCRDHTGKTFKVRGWESPRAGHAYDLEGPDADAVCMPPAPTVASDEMAVEMAEVYALSLLRDVPFSEIGAASADGHRYGADRAATDIADMSWFRTDEVNLSIAEARRRDARNLETAPQDRKETAKQKRERAARNAAVLFRGSSPGCMDGPYLSQYMLVGNMGRGGPKPTNSGTTLPGYNACFEPDDGYIVYGQQIIDQRCAVAEPGMDYMTDWHAWMDVQNGANAKGLDRYKAKRRFIVTPRDLATYVHEDQLYQAYLNACLIMLKEGHSFDSGFPSGGLRGRGSFATFGGPHVLALLTEVSSRALRAVRRQKFNYHRRCRPETVGAMLSLAASTESPAHWDARMAYRTMLGKLPDRLLASIVERNRDLAATAAGRPVVCDVPNPDWLKDDANYLLPMAFPEGSPMHPSYGAGHATVAGACVTVLKAFFEMFEGGDPSRGAIYTGQAYQPNAGDEDERGTILEEVSDDLTVAGELNKLAANISIGRNMAGVHYYTDYYDSLRMGERIAIAIIQEQMTNYPDRVSMTLPGFDGEIIRIATVDTGKSSIHPPVVEINGDEAGTDWWLCLS